MGGGGRPWRQDGREKVRCDTPSDFSHVTERCAVAEGYKERHVARSGDTSFGGDFRAKGWRPGAEPPTSGQRREARPLKTLENQARQTASFPRFQSAVRDTGGNNRPRTKEAPPQPQTCRATL